LKPIITMTKNLTAMIVLTPTRLDILAINASSCI